MRYLPVLIAVGAAIYLVIWFFQARADRRRSPDGPPRRARAPRRPLAPDDDPEFLAELDRRSREQRRRQGGPDGAPAGSDDAPRRPEADDGGRAAGPSAAGDADPTDEADGPGPEPGPRSTDGPGRDGDAAR